MLKAITIGAVLAFGVLAFASPALAANC